MRHWAWCGKVALSSRGELHRVASPVEMAVWYLGLRTSDLVWCWESGGVELMALAEGRPHERLHGSIGQGTLLSLRATGGPEVRSAAALMPWLELTAEGDDADRAAELLRGILLELEALEDRGYAVYSTRGPRLTVGAVAWATACELTGEPVSTSIEWGDYDAGRRAYYGGRCEVGQTTAPVVEGWDIAGAYPWALLQPVPVGQRRVAVGAEARRAYERGAPGCYWGRVVQPEDGIPRLPYRHRSATGRGRTRGPLLWVTGHVDGWWVPQELAEAEETGAEVFVGLAMLWDSEEAIWAPYVEHTSRDRAQRRAAGEDETSAKLLANSLSGKLAQSPQATTVRVLATGESPQLGWSWHGSRVWSKSHRHVPASARPIEAATVTARVRVALLRELLAHRDSWVYCDTDSVWLLPEGGEPDVDAVPWRSLGRGTSWEAPAPKTYRYRREDGELVTRASGVPVGLRETLGRFARGEPSTPRAHPCMPVLPTGAELRWAGLRFVEPDDRTRPLHRSEDGRLS